MTDQEIENAIEGVRCKGQNLNADDTRAYIAEMLVELLSWRRGDRQRIAGKNFARFKTPNEAQAKVKLAIARSEADATLMKAEAEAKGIEMKNHALAESQKLVEYTLAVQWDGHMPTTMMGHANPIMLLNQKESK